MDSTKRCNQCGEVKPLSEFYTRHKIGRPRAACKACDSVSNHERRQAAKARIVSEGSKVCVKCGLEKPRTAFLKAPGNKDGRATRCKACYEVRRMELAATGQRTFPESKICSACGEEKPATTEFWHKNRHGPDGLLWRCKTCSAVEAHERWEHSHRWRGYNRNYNRRVRLEVLKHYGGEPPHCACCGEDRLQFLTIEHSRGDGGKHRKEIGKAPGQAFNSWLKVNGFPDDLGLVVNCWNCNCAKAYFGGRCPHEDEREAAAST